MTESQFIDKLDSLWHSESLEPIYLAQKATRAHPQSPTLWCMFGDLVSSRCGTGDIIKAEDLEIELEDARRFYMTALEVDPSYGEAHEALGYYVDTYDDDFVLAEKYFREAISFGGEEDSFVGLARTLAQAGRKSEAIALLGPEACPFASEAKCCNMRKVIEDGDWDPI